MHITDISIILLIVFSVVLIPSAYAINFKDHTGYTPNWALQMGKNQVLSVCINVNYSTPDGNWCSEFTGYVLDNPDNITNETSSNQNQSVPNLNGSMFKATNSKLPDNAYVNNLYEFSIVPPQGWISKENPELIGGGAALVGFFSSNSLTYTPNFLISYKDLGTSFSYTTTLSDQDFLNSVVQGLLSTQDNQAKIMSKDIQSFSDGRKVTIDFIHTEKIQDQYIQLESEAVLFIFNSGEEYILNFESIPDDFDKNVDQFRNSVSTFYVGKTSTLSGISGQYRDSSNGFSMEMPKDWTGFKAGQFFIIFPNDAVFTPIPDPGVIVQVTNGISNSSSTSDNSCKTLSLYYFLLNDISIRKEIVQCSSSKLDSYETATSSGKLIGVIYLANTTRYSNHVSDFENMMNTLHVDSPISVKDFIRKQAGYQTNTYQIQAGSILFPLKSYSTSNIINSPTMLGNNKISIKVNETAGNGTTILAISKILTQPYSVTLDGKVTSYEIINDEIENVTEISFDYDAGEHTIIISGGALASQTTPLVNNSIPSWIRNNAKWWHDGTISDTDFEKGIEYLIKQKILTVPVESPSVSESPKQVPLWVKNTAGWWGNGKVSDNDFVKGLQYLIQLGIIKV